MKPKTQKMLDRLAEILPGCDMEYCASLPDIDQWLLVEAEGKHILTIPLGRAVILGYDLGMYDMHVHIRHGTIANVKYSGGCYKTVKEGHPDECSMIHPHIFQSRMCYGNAQGTAHMAMSSRNLPVLIEISSDIINSYNVANPYICLGRLVDVSKVCTCETRLTKDWGICADCGCTICRQCAHRGCNKCSNAVCKKCYNKMTKCIYTGNTMHNGCWTKNDIQRIYEGLVGHRPTSRVNCNCIWCTTAFQMADKLGIDLTPTTAPAQRYFNPEEIAAHV